MSQGPSIHPRFVGQATVSSGWMSWWNQPSMAHLIGVRWVHGIAFGSPVVPEENRMFMCASGEPATVGNGPSPPRKSSHRTSPGRSVVALSVPATTQSIPDAATILSYMGRSLPARRNRSRVTINTGPVISRRRAISSGANESAMDTTTAPVATMPRYAITDSIVIGMAIATRSPAPMPRRVMPWANRSIPLRSSP
jgi:hypothetical protein